MESVNEVKQQLSARARSVTLDELAGEGRTRVPVIRAEHIAQMIREAVHAAIDGSGLLNPREVDALVERGCAEFRDALGQREQELQSARESEARLNATEREVAVLKARCAALTQDSVLSRSELQQVQDELEAARASSLGGSQPDVDSSELIAALAREVAALRESVNQRMVAPLGGQPHSADFEVAFDKLASKLGDRLDTFGKKLGLGNAIGVDAQVNIGSIFDDDGATDLESNMQDIQPHQQVGGSIAENLAKLRALKADG